jgi:hypothetical protein
MNSMRNKVRLQHATAAVTASACAISALLADVPAGATRVVDDCYDYTDADQIGEGTYGKVYRSATAPHAAAPVQKCPQRSAMYCRE